MKYSDTVIIIPSRYCSTRLEGKPLVDINGTPMIVRVMNIATSLKLCDVYVATDDDRIANTVKNNNGNVVLTDSNLHSGTDRVFQALNKIEKKTKQKFDFIVNLQGDMPNIDGIIIKDIIKTLHKKQSKQQKINRNIITAVYKIVNQSWRKKPQCVKAIIAHNNKENYHRCLYFSRSDIPSGSGNAYAHLGIYGYTRDSLCKFVKLSASPLEESERLEQLRALENNLEINAVVVDSFPVSVDTKEDLKDARELIK